MAIIITVTLIGSILGALLIVKWQYSTVEAIREKSLPPIVKKETFFINREGEWDSY